MHACYVCLKCTHSNGYIQIEWFKWIIIYLIYRTVNLKSTVLNQYPLLIGQSDLLLLKASAVHSCVHLKHPANFTIYISFFFIIYLTVICSSVGVPSVCLYFYLFPIAVRPNTNASDFKFCKSTMFLPFP